MKFSIDENNQNGIQPPSKIYLKFLRIFINFKVFGFEVEMEMEIENY